MYSTKTSNQSGLYYSRIDYDPTDKKWWSGVTKIVYLSGELSTVNGWETHTRIIHRLEG